MWPTDTGDYENIALVYVDQPITMNKYISTIRIPQGGADYTSKNITALNRFRKFKLKLRSRTKNISLHIFRLESSKSSFYGALQSLGLTIIPDTSCLVPYSFCSRVTKPRQAFSAGNLGKISIFNLS